MRSLILGATGMLGHAIWLNLAQNHTAHGTIRGTLGELTGKCSIFSRTDARIIDEVDVLRDEDINKALNEARPDVVINCVGVVKQLPAANIAMPSISLNSLYPHRLAKICGSRRIRLIHVSTDCVFSGIKGGYVEGDMADASDLYGRTKYLGEVSGTGCLTIRTSIVGRQLSGQTGLLEWFLSKKGTKVAGYRKAIFSGLTTYALAEIIKALALEHPNLSGLYHVSSEPINKHDLLIMLADAMNLDTEVVPDDGFVIDRSLDSARFWTETGIPVPNWHAMSTDLAERVSAYEKWRY
ncbi:dTDP-4-dehydrorhamnose reductase family protein [Elusimicrobiota bacterium]